MPAGPYSGYAIQRPDCGEDARQVILSDYSNGFDLRMIRKLFRRVFRRDASQEGSGKEPAIIPDLILCRSGL